MLSIFDVVWEKANFKRVLPSVTKKLQGEEFIKTEKNVSYDIPLSYYELCLRVALRMVHLYKNRPDIAYGDLLFNATQIGEEEQAKEIIQNLIADNETEKIKALLVFTAIYARYDKGHYLAGSVNPDIKEIPNTCIDFIRFLINQIHEFEKAYNAVPITECQFEGAYNEIISKGYCGMPTYLIEDTIWVFSLGFGSKWGVVLLLIAYVMGMHSDPDVYKKVSRLGIFHVYGGCTETVRISEISDKTFLAICMNYIGYEISKSSNDWLQSSGTNQDRFESAIHYHKKYLPNLQINELEPENFADGIYEVKYFEYWRYYEKYVDCGAIMPTKPTYIESVYMIKSSQYIMFIAKGNRGLYLLQGGKFIYLENDDINFYYSNLKEYGDKVCSIFSNYWNALELVSDFVKKINIPSLFSRSGNIHGCIVDIDFYNHIYVNPFDGKITPYFAENTSKSKPYNNLASLISDQCPDYMNHFKELCNDVKYELITSENQDGNLVALTSSDIKICQEISTDHKLYDVSRLMKLFQKVHDANLIIIWSDIVLRRSEKLVEAN